VEILLDTSVLIDTLRSRNGRKELLARLVREGHQLSITPINIAELYVGMRAREEERTTLLLASLECHNLDAQTAKRAGLLMNQWAKRGKTLSLPDAIVAEIAIDRGCELMTDNRIDFPMTEIKLYPLS